MEINAFPHGEPADRLDRRPIASLRFVADPSSAKDPLFRSIPHRRSNKQPVDMSRPVDAGRLQLLSHSSFLKPRSQPLLMTHWLAKLRALTLNAWKIELATERTWLESVKLMRIGRRKSRRTQTVFRPRITLGV